MSLRRRIQREDRGATLIIVAISIVALFTIVAIVIDLGAVRSQRRTGQSAADNAASAAGAALAESDAVTACLDAFGYLEVNLGLSAGAFTGTSCSTLASTCNDLFERKVPRSADEYTVTVVHPVTDLLADKTSTELLRGSAIGDPNQATTADDGAPCDRIGVQVAVDGNTFFGGVVGIADYDTTVHAVSRVNSGSTETRPLNLLILDRTACQTIDIGGLAQLIVRAPFDPDTGEFTPGIAAADSDASGCSSPNKAVLEASGNNSLLRADGPCTADATTECPAEGSIEIFSNTNLGDGSCIGTAGAPTCRGFDDASIQPDVNASLGQFTRSPIDYRYNCKADYSSEPWYGSQAIPGCADPNAGSYIDTLKAHAGSITSANAAANGYTVISGPACTNNAGPKVEYVPGNYYVDCTDFRLNGGQVEFQGGNIIFESDVTLNSSSSLQVNTCPPLPAPPCGAVTWTSGPVFTAANAQQASEDAAWVYLKGDLSRSGGVVELNKTMVVLPTSSDGIGLTGGSDPLLWTAPDLPTWAFDDLALWSEAVDPAPNTPVIAFSGQGDLTLEGVFFVPLGTISYTGNGVQRQADAQFIGNKLVVTGQGTLAVVPAPNRSVEFPIDPTSGLIR